MNLHLRELSPDEKLKVRQVCSAQCENFLQELYVIDDEMHQYLKGELLLRLIAFDLQRDKKGTVSYQCLTRDINPNIQYDIHDPVVHDALMIPAILEAWLYDTMEFKDNGRVGNLYKGSLKGLEKSISFSIWAFLFGVDNTLFLDHYPSNISMDAQIRRFYEEEFSKISAEKEMDMQQEGIWMYRYIVSVLDYLGFKFVGKQ